MLVLADWQVARDEKLSFALCKRHVPLKNIDTADTIGQWLLHISRCSPSLPGSLQG